MSDWHLEKPIILRKQAWAARLLAEAQASEQQAKAEAAWEAAQLAWRQAMVAAESYEQQLAARLKGGQP